VSFVHFHNQHEDSSDLKDKVVQLTQILSHYQPYSRLYMVPFGELQRALIGYIPSKLRMVAYRRMMLRIASLIRGREKAAAYFTGDSVGQVVSQTLTNLHAIHAIADAPILSPLIGYSKHEIINEARRIDTFETSILPYSDCCSFLVDENPNTGINERELRELEEDIPLAQLIDKTLKDTEVIGIERGEVIRRKNVHVYIPNNFDYLDPSQFVPSVAPEEQEDTEIETT